jgi:threonine-phosphate decarboxylase
VGLPVHGGDVFELARRHRMDPQDIVDFSSNVNPLGPPPSALERLGEAEWMVSRYPDPSYRDFRRAVADYTGRSEAEVLEGNGATELIYLFADAFVKEGGRVVIPVPSFGEYERAASIRGGSPVFVPPRPGFDVDVDGIAEELRKGCAAIFLSSPNNPTSRTVTREGLLRLLELARDGEVPVCLDEAFVEFTDRAAGLSARLGEFPNLLIVRSLTKIFGLPGLRVGYGLSSKEMGDRLRAAKMPWSLNVLAQEAAIAALGDEAFLRRSRAAISEERGFLYEGLRRISRLEVFLPEANFILARISDGPAASELKSLLLERRILIRDCSSFRGLGTDYFRVAVRLREDNAKLLSALGEVI